MSRHVWLIVVGVVISGLVALPAGAAVVVYDDFSGPNVDTTKWDLGGTTTPYISNGEIRCDTDSASTINGKEYIMELPDAIGEKLTVEFAWRRWVGISSFVGPTVSFNAVDLDAGGNPVNRTWMGAVDTWGTGSVYRVKDANNTNWVTSSFLIPPNNDFTYDYFQFIYEVVDNGGSARHDFTLRVKDAGGSWQNLVTQTGYTARREFGTLRFGAGTRPLGIDYVQYEFIPEPATMSLLLVGLPFVFRRRKQG